MPLYLCLHHLERLCIVSFLSFMELTFFWRGWPILLNRSLCDTYSLVLVDGIGITSVSKVHNVMQWIHINVVWDYYSHFLSWEVKMSCNAFYFMLAATVHLLSVIFLSEVRHWETFYHSTPPNMMGSQPSD